MAEKVYEVTIRVENVPDDEGNDSQTIDLLCSTLGGLLLVPHPADRRTDGLAPQEYRRLSVARIVRAG